MNPEWQAADGGCVRLFTNDGPQDIAPVADRLLLFLSSWIEHEVLPVNKTRFALTTWLA